MPFVYSHRAAAHQLGFALPSTSPPRLLVAAVASDSRTACGRARADIRSVQYPAMNCHRGAQMTRGWKQGGNKSGSAVTVTRSVVEARCQCRQRFCNASNETLALDVRRPRLRTAAVEGCRAWSERDVCSCFLLGRARKRCCGTHCTATRCHMRLCMSAFPDMCYNIF